jgi:hypothetical protein
MILLSKKSSQPNDQFDPFVQITLLIKWLDDFFVLIVRMSVLSGKTTFFYHFQHFPPCFFFIDFSTNFPSRTHVIIFSIADNNTQSSIDLAPMTVGHFAILIVLDLLDPFYAATRFTRLVLVVRKLVPTRVVQGQV